MVLGVPFNKIILSYFQVGRRRIHVGVFCDEGMYSFSAQIVQE